MAQEMGNEGGGSKCAPGNICTCLPPTYTKYASDTVQHWITAHTKHVNISQIKALLHAFAELKSSWSLEGLQERTIPANAGGSREKMGLVRSTGCLTIF